MSQLEKIYGVHAVQALLQHHPKRVKQIWLSEGRSEPRLQALLALAAENRVAVGQPSGVSSMPGSKACTKAWSPRSARARYGARRCSRNCSNVARPRR